MKKVVLITSVILVAFCFWTATAQETRRGETAPPYFLVNASAAEARAWLADPPSPSNVHCPPGEKKCSCTDVKDCIVLIESNKCSEDFNCAPTPNGPVCVCTKN